MDGGVCSKYIFNLAIESRKDHYAMAGKIKLEIYFSNLKLHVLSNEMLQILESQECVINTNIRVKLQRIYACGRHVGTNNR